MEALRRTFRLIRVNWRTLVCFELFYKAAVAVGFTLLVSLGFRLVMRVMGLKCAIDRFYSVLYPKAPKSLRKVAMLLSSGDPEMYIGARFSYEGDFLGYLGLEDVGIVTNHDENYLDTVRQMATSL